MCFRLSDIQVQRGRSRWEHTGERQVGESPIACLRGRTRRSSQGPRVAERVFAGPCSTCSSLAVRRVPMVGSPLGDRVGSAASHRAPHSPDPLL
jgi:hypothetical protein